MSWHKLSNSDSWLLLQNYCSYSERASPARGSPKEQAASCSLQFCEQASPIRRDKGVRTRSKLLVGTSFPQGCSPEEQAASCSLQFCEQASPIRRDKGVRTRSKLLDAVVHMANEQDYKNGVRKQLSFELCRGLQLRSVQGGAGRLPAPANAPKISNWKASQGGEGRLPAAATAPKIANWKASRRWQAKIRNWKASKRCGHAGSPQQRTRPRSQLEGFTAACGQAAPSSEPRFPLGRLQGGAGRLPAAAQAPKIPNWKASQGGEGRLPAAATAPKIANWKASRRCGQAARSSECTQDFQLEASGRCGLPAAANAPKASQGGAGRLPAAADAPKIPNWKARRRAGRLRAAANQDSQLEGLKAVRAGCPQQRKHPRFPKASKRCGQAARSKGTQDSQLEGFKAVRASGPHQRMHQRFLIGSFRAVRAGCPQQQMHPRFPIGRLHKAVRAAFYECICICMYVCMYVCIYIYRYLFVSYCL